jgi:hypothetical protein
MISLWLGKRPASSFENTSSPSTATSKMPFDPRISTASTASASFSAAARPVARGR